MSSSGDRRRRRLLAAVAGLTSVAAWAGAAQLALGVYTPPVSDLEPLGLHSWLLPGVWLAASVAVPCLVVAVLALRGSARTGRAALVAAALLAVELVVQVPFVGLDPLQAVMAVVALALATLGVWAPVSGRAAPRPASTRR